MYQFSTDPLSQSLFYEFQDKTYVNFEVMKTKPFIGNESYLSKLDEKISLEVLTTRALRACL